MTSPYLRAVLRFWWLMLLALPASAAVAIVMLYRVDTAFPPSSVPKLTERSPTYYHAATEMRVDSPGAPYLQAGVRVAQTTRPAPGKADDKKAAEAAAANQLEPTVVTDRKALVDAANLYPLIIESDEVASIRERNLGLVPGQVSAKALYSLAGENRFRPSVLPVIQIVAKARTQRNALLLVQGTADAFVKWLALEQKRAKIPASQRIVIRQLRQPQRAAPTGGPAFGLPLVAGAGVLFAFAAFAILLDRAFPRRLAPAGRVVELSEVTGTDSVAELYEQVQATLVQLTNGGRQTSIERASESAK